MRKKILINGLGPTRTLDLDGTKYKDGDVVEVNEPQYKLTTEVLKVAVLHTEESEKRVKRLIDSADKKRHEIEQKVSDLKNE